MANFDSPISRKQAAEDQLAQQRLDSIRHFSVPNATQQSQSFQSTEFENPQQLESQLKQARQDKILDKLSPEAKKRIEIVSGIGRLTKDIEIDGILFCLRTLKSKEFQEATLSTTHLKFEAEVAYSLRRQYLARSVYKIGQTDIEMFLGDNSIEAKLAFIDELDDVILQKLLAEYSKLNDESKIKYGLKTPEQAKEVVEDLKK